MVFLSDGHTKPLPLFHTQYLSLSVSGKVMLLTGSAIVPIKEKANKFKTHFKKSSFFPKKM